MLFRFKHNLILVLYLDFLDGGEEVLMLALFARLKCREIFCFIKHLLGVFVSLHFNFFLLLVEELASVILHCAA